MSSPAPPRSDVEPYVRTMLAEFDIDVQSPHEEADQYRVLLRAFGYWDLPFHQFEGRFYARLLSWDAQDELDRTLVLLLHELDQVSSPTDRLAIEREMRSVVRADLIADE